MMSLPVIEAINLVKAFGKHRALDGFNLSVEQGEVHGFLGPNGAGKSTTIKALLGQLKLDEGSARVFGDDSWSQSVEAHERLAYVPGDIALWDSLSGGECIDILVRLQGKGDTKKRNELIERFELDPTKKTRTYSKGNRQKVALIAAFSKNADLLLLDEPTSGLDPLMEEQFQECVLAEKARGTTVLLSSHILSEVERLCDRATIIRQGQNVSSGTIASLSSGTSSVLSAVTSQEPRGLEDVDGVTDLVVSRVDGGTRIDAHVRKESIGVVTEQLAHAGTLSLTITPPSLNTLFLDLYKTSDEAAAARQSEKHQRDADDYRPRHATGSSR